MQLRASAGCLALAAFKTFFQATYNTSNERKSHQWKLTFDT